MILGSLLQKRPVPNLNLRTRKRIMNLEILWQKKPTTLGTFPQRHIFKKDSFAKETCNPRGSFTQEIANKHY